MKSKVILCLALLILIAFSGTNTIMAKKDPSVKSFVLKGHPWSDEIPRITRPAPSTGISIFFCSQHHIIIVSVIKSIQNADEVMKIEKKSLKAIKGIKNAGADKNLRRRDQGEAIQD
jgi:hypothetical protein